jgi:hypothetical protein
MDGAVPPLPKEAFMQSTETTSYLTVFEQQDVTANRFISAQIPSSPD